MAYTLGQAAKATGKSKSGIALAISKGWITATKNLQGQWQIEPSELHRVYRPLGDKMNDGLPRHGDNWTVEIAHLKATLEGLERLNRQVENERDSFRALLDTETEERRRIQAQLTALLSDQRKQPEPPPIKRSWWQFGDRR